MNIQRGKLRLEPSHTPVTLTAACWRDDTWHDIALTPNGDVLLGHDRDVRVTIRLARDARNDAHATWRYELAFTASHTTRVALRLELDDQPSEDRFHLIPGVIFGDNNLALSKPGHMLNLTTKFPESPSCSPYWEMRADRASHPVSMIVTKGVDGRAGVIASITINPYSHGKPVDPSWPEDFVRNGVFAQVAHEGKPDTCGVSLGYGNLPRNLYRAEAYQPSTFHLTTGASAHGRIDIRRASVRADVHPLIHEIYDELRDTPTPPITREQAIAALVDAFMRVSWHDETGKNALGSQPPRMTPYFGGTEIKENFTNMRCADEAKKDLKAWRTLAEIGWSGGGVVADPLLRAGHALGDAIAQSRANEILNRIAGAFNPKSGLLWDVAGKHEGHRLNWWWSGYLIQDVHCAYTNGSALFHLLKAYGASRTLRGGEQKHWLETACKALDTITRLQLPNGNFGYTYAADREALLDPDSFAGVWFVPALALAYEYTKAPHYLAAAERGARYYHALGRDLNSAGTPMDIYKAPDQEGNLGLVRGAALLHRLTGRDEFLAMLADAAGYEYLWRYAFRTRPQYKPLAGSHFNSCGGSITSVAMMIHPMGLKITSDLKYLARMTGDDYHARRADDGVNWGVNTVSLWPDVTGYGIRGVMTERYCQSDVMFLDNNPDFTPSSLWRSYNGWAAAATLEGLIEA